MLAMTRKWLCLTVTFLGLVIFVSRVSAQTTSSTNYKSTEYYFGSGGDPNVSSTNYKARGSAGSLGVGQTTSTNYVAEAGFVTPSEEYLEMVLSTSTTDLGTLTTSAASTGTANFYVRAYVSSGYNIKSVSGTPANGARALAAMTTAGASTPGTEQFGINLVANTSPATFGADPAPQPGSGWAYGAAASGYSTTNNYKYNSGDTIATAPKGIGQTNFTISFIANISSITPGGSYTVDQEFVAVASY